MPEAGASHAPSSLMAALPTNSSDFQAVDCLDRKLPGMGPALSPTHTHARTHTRTDANQPLQCPTIPPQIVVIKGLSPGAADQPVPLPGLGRGAGGLCGAPCLRGRRGAAWGACPR